MSFASLLTAVAFFIVLALTVRPLGAYMDAVYAGRSNVLTRVAGPLERLVYRICRVDVVAEMSWKSYTFALLALSAASVAFIYLALRVQAFLPLNPQHFGNLAPDLAWNTAISFATTTDWQFYSGESTMSYFSQMAVLAWQNFIAAAVGLTVAIALARGLARQNSATIGNFWVDLTRSILYVLLPLAIAFSLAFLIEGVPQNFAPYHAITTLDGANQTITGGPMASQESIKLLGGNGGGFVGANSSSPNENPTPFANVLQLLAMFLIPAALTYTFGGNVKDRRQGWAIFWKMSGEFRRERSPLRRRKCRSLTRGRNRLDGRRGQLHLRFADAPGRTRCPGEHAIRRGRLRRRMGGLGPNAFYNVALGIAMIVARYASIVPTLALAGVLAAKPRNDATKGTLRTDSALFVAADRQRRRRRRTDVPACGRGRSDRRALAHVAGVVVLDSRRRDRRRRTVIRTDDPHDGCRTAAPLATIGCGRNEVFPAMFLLEISVIVLSAIAFALFDAYARTCARI